VSLSSSHVSLSFTLLGKETKSGVFACIAGLAAYTLNRPCSINIERDVDMSITGQRHAFRIDYKAGCKKDGSFSYFEGQFYSNGGYSLDLSQPVMDRALFHCDNCYHWPALSIKGLVCKTNQPSHTAFRGFGGPQGMLIAETIIQHFSEILKISPEVIRERNFYQEGGSTHYGNPIENFYVPSLWKQIHNMAEIDKRNKEIEEFNAKNRWMKRGLSIIPTKFGINFTAKFMNQVREKLCKLCFIRDLCLCLALLCSSFFFTLRVVLWFMFIVMVLFLFHMVEQKWDKDSLQKLFKSLHNLLIFHMNS
jgi:xanthine dehydrogenase/oxidase